MRNVLLVLAFAGSQEPAVPRVTPEQAHRDAKAMSTMCGITARDALDFKRIVTRLPHYHQQSVTSSRFDLYATDDGLTQWVFTKPTEPAYPAVSCRHVFRDAQGGTSQTRDLHCDASRAACDKVFIEFRDLDARMQQSLHGG